MSYARAKIKGVTCYDSRRAYNGFTLFTPINGKRVYLIDMRGQVVNQWQFPYDAGCYGEMLANGNLLYAGKSPNNPLAEIEGSGGILIEMDKGGNIVWEYRDELMHHAFFRLKNHNTLVMRWVPMPPDIAAGLVGGNLGSEHEGIIYSEAIREIRPNGTVAWEWVAHEHIEIRKILRCPLCPRNTWLHANACQELPDGNLLVCFAKANMVAIINKKSCQVQWQWGNDGELAHPHSPSWSNGNVVIFDNGFHPNGLAQNYSRVVEVDPHTNKMVWSYDGPNKGNMRMLFYSSMYSSAQRLPNGNTLICEGMTGRLFEITPWGDIVWEYINPYPFDEDTSSPPSSKPVYNAFRYGIDYLID